MKGGNLLKPVTFTKGKNSDSIRDPEQFIVPPNEPDGILSWSFQNETSVWIENLDLGPAKVKVERPDTSISIPPEHLASQYDPSSMIILPLKDQGFVIGVYCIDLRRSDVITESFYNELQLIRKAFSKFLMFSHQHRQRTDAANLAVKHFLDDVRDVALPKDLLRATTDHRRAFFARPFSTEFSDLEKEIATSMSKNGVEAKSSNPIGDQQPVVESIIQQIDDSHFGVADITGSNPNVLAEVGMMFMANKRVMLLKSKLDDNQTPFNLAHRFVYEYVFDATTKKLMAYLKGERNGLSFEECVADFCKKMENDEKFSSASKYKPDNKSKTTRKTNTTTRSTNKKS